MPRGHGKRVIEVAIESRRAKVAELYIKRLTQQQIAEELKISQGTVSKDIAAVRKEWRETRITDFTEIMNFELAKVDRVEREAWLAWEKSLQNAETWKQIDDGETERIEQISVGQSGNPKFLDIICQCTLLRRKILGIDKPEDERADTGEAPVIVEVLVKSRKEAKQFMEFSEFQRRLVSSQN